MKYPDYVKNCIELLEKSGYSAYAVGGAVRDGLLGKEPSDWDVTTSAKPEQTLEVFKDFRTIPTGIKHGTVTVLFSVGEKNVPIEITTFRVDGEYRDSRHPESVAFSNDVRDDLSRRDFTVNAMAFNEKEGVIDAFGGKLDLENRVIRAVGNPEKRFSEDALRILRAFRFASQLEFEIEEKTLLCASKCAHLLKNIARERVGAEFKKMISCKGAEYSLNKMIEGEIWQHIFDTPALSLQTISKISALKDGNFATRLAVLVNEYSELEKDAFLTSLRLSNAEKKLVLRVCTVKSFAVPENEIKFSAVARHFLHLYNNIYDEALEVLEIFGGTNTAEFVRTLEIERNKNNPLLISDLSVNGSDILPLCEGDFSRVGKILEKLLVRVIDNPELNKKEILIEIAKKELH